MKFGIGLSPRFPSKIWCCYHRSVDYSSRVTTSLFTYMSAFPISPHPGEGNAVAINLVLRGVLEEMFTAEQLWATHSSSSSGAASSALAVSRYESIRLFFAFKY
jgi:hypothetical protein